jgi:hypothetical protein
MTKRAHITSRPEYGVGDRVLGLCGKKFTVTELWADVPRDKAICRDCVDRALEAMTEADDLIRTARIHADFVASRVGRLGDLLNPPEFALDVIAEDDEDHRVRRAEKAQAKATRERARQTCTCTWTDADTFTEDPACPIHGNSDG